MDFLYEDLEVRVWPPVDLDEYPYLEETEIYLKGWPGFRNRPGRSGLDYLDCEFELAHMEGLFIHALIFLRLRTAEVYQLILMFGAGALSLLLGSLAMLEWILTGTGYFICWIVCFPPASLGVLLLVNFVLSVGDMLKNDRMGT